MRVLMMVLWSLLFAAGCVAPSPPSQAAAEAPTSASQQPSLQPPAAPSAEQEPAPRPSTQQPPAAAQPEKPRVGQPIKMPPMSDPLPPERAQVPSPTQPNRSCKTDSDCVVKNVGNCCGYFPACVHKDSPTDPAGVQAQCAKSGMASACGFPSIEGCHCARGQCVASVAAIDPSQDPPASDPVR